MHMAPTQYEHFAKIVLGACPDVKDPVAILNEMLDIVNRNLEYKPTPPGIKGEYVEINYYAALLEARGRHPRVAQLISTVRDLMKTPDGSPLLGTLLRFRASGCKTFNVSPGLTEALLNTDVSGTYEFLKAPYKTLLFRYSEGAVSFKGEGTEQHTNCVYVIDAGGQLSFKILTEPYWWASCVSKDMDKGRVVNFDDFDSGAGGVVPEGIRLAVKTLLYINSERPDVTKGPSEYARVQESIRKSKEKKKVERLVKYASTLSQLEYWDVGSTIKIMKAEPGAVRDQVRVGDSFHYAYRFCVRGHFRNQACGVGYGQRKLTWIAPYMKGPDQAQILHRQYDVE